MAFLQELDSSHIVLLASAVSSGSLYPLLLDVRSFLQFQVQINYKEGTTEILLAVKQQSFLSSGVLGAQVDPVLQCSV